MEIQAVQTNYFMSCLFITAALWMDNGKFEVCRSEMMK